MAVLRLGPMISGDSLWDTRISARIEGMQCTSISSCSWDVFLRQVRRIGIDPRWGGEHRRSISLCISSLGLLGGHGRVKNHPG